jgi:predicted nucleic acid-binding protein
MILLDTSILLDVLHGNKDTITLVQKLPPESLHISIVTFTEIELGFALLQSQRNREAQRLFHTLVEEHELEVIRVGQEVASQYVHIQAKLHREGNTLARFDALIAATALAFGLQLVTLDTDFQRVKELRLYPLA